MEKPRRRECAGQKEVVCEAKYEVRRKTVEYGPGRKEDVHNNAW